MLAIHSLGISICVLITWILVIPVHDPDRAVWTDLRAHRAEPTVIRADEILHETRFERRTVGREFVLVNCAVVDVPHQNGSLVFLRILVALINLRARIGRPEMFVIDDRRQILEEVAHLSDDSDEKEQREQRDGQRGAEHGDRRRQAA